MNDFRAVVHRPTILQGWSAWGAVGLWVILTATYIFLIQRGVPAAPLYVITSLISLVLVYGDCGRTHMNRFWWSLLAFFTGSIGLWIYLLVRNRKGRRG